MRREKSLRIGVHHANAVVWEPVYRTHLVRVALFVRRGERLASDVREADGERAEHAAAVAADADHLEELRFRFRFSAVGAERSARGRGEGAGASDAIRERVPSRVGFGCARARGRLMTTTAAGDALERDVEEPRRRARDGRGGVHDRVREARERESRRSSRGIARAVRATIRVVVVVARRGPSRRPRASAVLPLRRRRRRRRHRGHGETREGKPRGASVARRAMPRPRRRRANVPPLPSQPRLQVQVLARIAFKNRISSGKFHRATRTVTMN
eukprot:31544-Pelagococcus_subviridis.AAC.15